MAPETLASPPTPPRMQLLVARFTIEKWRISRDEGFSNARGTALGLLTDDTEKAYFRYAHRIGGAGQKNGKGFAPRVDSHASAVTNIRVSD